MYLTNKGTCAMCPGGQVSGMGAEEGCQRCAPLTGQCLECPAGQNPSGTQCVTL